MTSKRESADRVTPTQRLHELGQSLWLATRTMLHSENAQHGYR
jgi:hypothetical protein